MTTPTTNVARNSTKIDKIPLSQPFSVSTIKTSLAAYASIFSQQVASINPRAQLLVVAQPTLLRPRTEARLFDHTDVYAALRPFRKIFASVTWQHVYVYQIDSQLSYASLANQPHLHIYITDLS